MSALCGPYFLRPFIQIVYVILDTMFSSFLLYISTRLVGCIEDLRRLSGVSAIS